jgi:hypothetical protein
MKTVYSSRITSMERGTDASFRRVPQDQAAVVEGLVQLVVLVAVHPVDARDEVELCRDIPSSDLLNYGEEVVKEGGVLRRVLIHECP